MDARSANWQLGRALLNEPAGLREIEADAMGGRSLFKNSVIESLLCGMSDCTSGGIWRTVDRA